MPHQPKTTRFLATEARFSSVRAVGLMVGMLLIGIVVVWRIFASGSPIAFEAESGTLAGGALKITDAAASGTNAVKFAPTASGAFVHPGIAVTTAQLDFVKTKLAANAKPWSDAFAYTKTARGNVVAPATTGQLFSSLSYVAHPVATIDCVNDNNGCTAMVVDGLAAYTDALEYSLASSADPNKDAYAQKAIEILNAWAATSTGWNGPQAQLEIGWAGDTFPRAAELIRYTYTAPTREQTLNTPALEAMLTNAWMPAVENGDATPNGNWELAMADAMVSIGVFTNNHAAYDKGIALWRARVPAYLYQATDNNSNGQPVTPPGGKFTTPISLTCFWLGDGGPGASSCTIPNSFRYTDGMAQETCRDISHVSLGLSVLSDAAVTARIQGLDLFAQQQKRLVDGFEYAAKYNLSWINSGNWPDAPCGGRPGQYGQPSAVAGDGTGGIGYKLGGWEIGYNELSVRLKAAMPNTLSYLIQVTRPSAYKVDQSSAWDMLTQPDQ
jgi:hypothetical protein